MPQPPRARRGSADREHSPRRSRRTVVPSEKVAVHAPSASAFLSCSGLPPPRPDRQLCRLWTSRRNLPRRPITTLPRRRPITLRPSLAGLLLPYLAGLLTTLVLARLERALVFPTLIGPAGLLRGPGLCPHLAWLFAGRRRIRRMVG